MTFICSFAAKRKLFRIENGHFIVLQVGFHGDMDTFVAREHITNGMFHFSLKF